MAQRLQGWLQVADKAALDQHRTLSTKKPRRRLYRWRVKSCTSNTQLWRSYFCYLQVTDNTLRHSLNERRGSQTKGRTLRDLRLRLERGRRQGAGGSTAPEAQSPSPLTEEDDSELSETTSLREDRVLLRYATNGNTLGTPSTTKGPCEESSKRHTTIGFAVTPEIECPSPPNSHEQSPVGTPIKTMDTPSRLANFFSKKTLRNVGLKRTKSVTKLERKRSGYENDSTVPSQMRGSRSHESLLQSSPSLLGSVDLSAGDVRVSRVHNSLLDQNFCFQLSSKDGTTYYSCQTNQERDKWIHDLQQTINPNRDNQHRLEKSLSIWLLEAKGVSTKKKYFCEICLDKTLYARTSSKLKNELCFWGEQFDFNNLPQIDTITVNLYREADKKKRRDKNILIGSTEIDVNSLNGHYLTEKWYMVFTEKSSSGKDCPSLRIKTRFLNLNILPFNVYTDFLQYLRSDYIPMCEILEPAISVRTKEDIAISLIHIMEKGNMAKKFLTDIVMHEIEKIEDHRLMFRGNSTATKAIEAYMKLIGDKYLQDTLGEVIKSLMESNEDCEVDPIKVSSNSVLQQHQHNLMNCVQAVWNQIMSSAPMFPVELREIFSECKKKLLDKGKAEEMCDNLISASVFLRFLCPAILSPSLFNLAQEYPQGKTARKLTLIAKSIQTFANFTRFGGKESFMEFMNEFLEREWASMKSFLKEVSSPILSQPQQVMEFDGYIDEGRELAIMHNLLVEATSKIAPKNHFSEDFEKLQRVLDGVSAAASQPALLRQLSSPVPPSPVASDRMSHIGNKYHHPVPHKASTIPRTYVLGNAGSNNLNTNDDYVMLTALATEELPQHKNFIDVSHLHKPDHSTNDLPYTSSSLYHRKSMFNYCADSPVFQSDRQSLNMTPSNTNNFPCSRRQLYKDESTEGESFTATQNLSSHHTTNAYQPNQSTDISAQNTDSPRLTQPLGFNNPLYQHRVSPYQAQRQTSPLSSFSSESDEDIVMRQSCLGSTESAPALGRESRYCCTSSSSTDTNSCESPLPPNHLKLLKHLDGNRHIKQYESQKAQPTRSCSDSFNYEPKHNHVQRLSSIDSGLHKSYKSKQCPYKEYSTCAAQDRKTDPTKFSTLLSKATSKEYEFQVCELRTMMSQLHSKLQDAEVKLEAQENKIESVNNEWKLRMEVEDEKVRHQQEEKDQQMKSIITRLITVEEELRKEQKELQTLIADKQKIIEAQEMKISKLDATNMHLLTLLSQIRAQNPLHGRNGSTPPFKKHFVHRDFLFKSNSC